MQRVQMQLSCAASSVASFSCCCALNSDLLPSHIISLAVVKLVTRMGQ